MLYFVKNLLSISLALDILVFLTISQRFMFYPLAMIDFSENN